MGWWGWVETQAERSAEGVADTPAYSADGFPSLTRSIIAIALPDFGRFLRFDTGVAYCALLGLL